MTYLRTQKSVATPGIEPKSPDSQASNSRDKYRTQESYGSHQKMAPFLQHTNFPIIYSFVYILKQLTPPL